MNSGDTTLQSSAARQLRVQIESSRKQHILAHLYRNLEDLAYVQCAAILYCDQSLMFAFARWNVINNYTAANSLTAYRIPVILVLNLICTLWHLFGALPLPVSNGTRGYLSGSFVIDVVGEIPPSRMRLFYLDVFVLATLMLMVVVGHEQQKSQNKAKKRPVEVVNQDIDAEEQGIQRVEQPEEVTTTTEDIGDENSEDVTLLAGYEEEDGIPVLRLNLRDSVKEVINADSTADNEATAQRAQNRERLRRLLALLAQRAARN